MTQDSRLPYHRYDELDARGQEVWDGVAGSRGSALGGRIRFRTSIERRLSELAIITVGAAWKAEFEWWAHARMAREHGVSDAVVDAIGRGGDPPFEAEDERAIYTAIRQLTSTGRLGQDVYDAAQRLLGDAGMVELVSLCGYYTLISYLLNAFTVPLPPGARPQWGE